MIAKRVLGALLAAWMLPVAAMSAEMSDVWPGAESWQSPKIEEVRKQVFDWLNARKPDEQVRKKVESLWPQKEESLAGREMLARVVESFALVDDNARSLAAVCAGPAPSLVPPKMPWLADEANGALVNNNLRLWFGRWLVHQRFVDEAAEQLGGLKPQDVVDPATLLFYQSVVHHRFLDQSAGLETLEQLAERTDLAPRRYAALAKLMEADLQGLKEDSLDHIARRMDDIERRLDLGHAGKKVRDVQDGVIKSLDKLIEELEKQQQQQSSSSSSSGGSQSNNPAPDSTPMGGKGKGEVARRNVGSDSGWGNLPPKEREEALQQVGRDFPAHYRDLIEQYFRRLAAEGNE